MTDIRDIDHVEYRATDPRHPVSAVFVYPSRSHWSMQVRRGDLEIANISVALNDGALLLDMILPPGKRQLFVPPGCLMTLNPIYRLPII